LKFYFQKRKTYSTKNAEPVMWVWVVWEECGKWVEGMWKRTLWGNCGKNVENNNMKKCEKTMKRIV
jgi:hypothetical protein